MNALIPIGISLLVLAISAGLGRLASNLWRGKIDSYAEGLLIDTVLGAGVFSLIIFSLGILQLYSVNFLFGLIFECLVPILAFSLAIRNWRMRKAGTDSVDQPALSAKPERKTFAIIAAYALLTVLALATLIPALTPPAMSDWDSLAYHLAVPRLYLDHCGIYNITIMSHANFPFLMEMLYIPAIGLGVPEAARTINCLMAMLMVAAIALLTKRHFGQKAALTAALGFAGMPIVLFLATTAYIDLATALFAILSIHLLLNYLGTADRRWLIGCALASGFAASTKMTGLAVIPLVFIWLIADRCTASRKCEWKVGLIFLSFSLAVCSPWYIKTFIYTGNPVYPFFYGIFGGRGWSSELAKHYTVQQNLFGMGHDFLAFLMLPWNLAVNSAKFYDRPGLFIGPIFLIAVPILLLARYQSRKIKGLLWFFLASVVIWFELTHQSRYLIPGFGVLTILVSALVYEDKRLQIGAVVLNAIFVITALFGLFTLTLDIQRSLPYILGQVTRDEYLTRYLDTYPATQFINHNLPKSSRIALMGDTRGYYLNRDYVWADWGHSLEFSHRYASAEDLASYLRSRRITHVMINFRFFPERGAGTEPMYSAIDKGLFKRVYPNDQDKDLAVVYEILPSLSK